MNLERNLILKSKNSQKAERAWKRSKEKQGRHRKTIRAINRTAQNNRKSREHALDEQKSLEKQKKPCPIPNLKKWQKLKRA